MTLQTGARVGAYEIRGPLGAGGMGEVYRAWDARLGREVAVKVLPESAATNPDRLRRFEQEAKAAGALKHPNVLAVYDVGSHEALPFIVSELLEGDTLRAQIRAGALTVRKAVEHAVQIARGLAAAHQRGIVHRDLKPENVFVTRDGHVKILDFGLAKLRDEATSDPEGETVTHETRPGVVLGTVPYLSPEQVRGLPADARSDIFALGSVLYEMLARRRAFTGETTSEVETAILRAEPPELSSLDGRVPVALDRVTRRCLEKRPEDRFQKAEDVAFALEAAGATTSLPLVTEARRSGRRRATVLAALLLGLVAGAGLLAALRRPPPLPSYTQLTFRRGAILSARFAPDGQTVVYSAAWQGRPAQVYALRIGSSEDRPLGLEGIVLSVSARDEVAVKLGRFLIQRWHGRREEGTLARVSLAGGTAREMVENVVAADWDPEGEELAVVRRVEGRNRLEYPIGHELYRGDICSVRALPGQRFAISEAVEIGGGGRYRFVVSVIDRMGKRAVLSPGWRYWPNLSWSGSKEELLFAARREDDLALHAVSLAGRERLAARIPGDFELHDVDPRGRLLLEQRFRRGLVVGLAPGESRERDLSWLDYTSASDLSADGRQLVLGGWSPVTEGTEGTYLRKTDGSAAVRLGDENGLSLSPDGRFVLALPHEHDEADRLVLVPTGAGERRELGHGSLRFDESATAWFPDGKRIAVVGRTERRGPKRLFAWDLEPGAVPRPLSLEGDLDWPVVAPDGRRVAVQAGPAGIQVCPVEDGPARPVPGARPGDRPMRWSGDGRWLYVQRAGLAGGEAEFGAWIDRIEVATGARRPWKELALADPAGFSGGGFAYVTPDGSSYAYQFGSSVGRLYLAEGLR